MLNVTKIESLKAKDKPYKVSDAHGLYVDVRPSGRKYWRQKYRYNARRNYYHTVDILLLH